MGIELLIRPYRRSDKSLVFNSWLQSYRSHGEFPAGVPNKLYYYYQSRIIEGLMAISDVRMCCDASEPDLVFGWIAVQPEEAGALVVHYLYIKSQFRENGLARRLFDSVLDDYSPSVVLCSHKTSIKHERNGEQEYLSHTLKRNGVLYNPYVLMFEDAVATLPQEAVDGPPNNSGSY